MDEEKQSGEILDEGKKEIIQPAEDTKGSEPEVEGAVNGDGKATTEEVKGDISEADAETAFLILDQLEKTVSRLAEALAPLAESHSSIQKILAILEDRTNFDRSRELAIDKMYTELMDYRKKGNDLVKKDTLLNLLLLYDNMIQCAGGFEGKALSDLEWLTEMLLETLFREDVTMIDDSPKVVSADYHKVLKAVPTDDPALDRTVAEVVKKGFRWHDKLFRPENVTVFRYEAPKEPVTEEKTEPEPLTKENSEKTTN
ncbi:MAG: nucleotide exchange factor GrpE [bacterium]